MGRGLHEAPVLLYCGGEEKRRGDRRPAGLRREKVFLTSSWFKGRSIWIELVEPAAWNEVGEPQITARVSLPGARRGCRGLDLSALS